MTASLYIVALLLPMFLRDREALLTAMHGLILWLLIHGSMLRLCASFTLSAIMTGWEIAFVRYDVWWWNMANPPRGSVIPMWFPFAWSIVALLAIDVAASFAFHFDGRD